MVRHCSNCGEENLREHARFCDNCGAKLTAELDDRATQAVPDTGSSADAGLTQTMPALETSSDEVRGLSPDLAKDEGLTQTMSAFETSADETVIPTDEGLTQTMPALETDSEEVGRPGPDLAEDEGLTKTMPVFETSADEVVIPSAVDDGLTKTMPAVETSADEIIVPGAPVGEDEGLTKTMPAFETSQGRPASLSLDTSAAEDDGQTKVMSPTWNEPDDGQTQVIAETGLPPNNAEDDGQTKVMTEADDDGQTKVMTEADDNGQTKAMPEVVPGSTVKENGRTEDVIDPKNTKPTSPVPAFTPDLKIGQILQERYRLDKVLGQGGFGAVYLAEDLKLKRVCVVKQMLTHGKSPKEIEVHQANFTQEANLLAQLNHPGHPNIPEIYDYFSDESGNYLMMKYIEGQSLKDVLEQSEGKIPWQEAVRYAMAVCSALHYMHAQSEPVIHRDIKPANILLGDDGRVWLVDFGLAKADPVSSSGDLTTTRASGSFGYTPLEQWLGRAVPASDVYAIGATLHHLVTGANPLEAYGGEFHIKKLQELHGHLPLIRTIDRKLPQGLEEMISRATAAEPEQRPTPLQLEQQLEALISGAQGAALFTFKNGRSAKTVSQLVDLCEQNRREAQEYLYSGDFERWFRLINRNDLAAAAAQAVQQGKNQKEGLEKFLKLIHPNLLSRRLMKAGWHLTRLLVQFGLIFIVATLLVIIAVSYGAGYFIERSISTTPWPFYRIKLEEDKSTAFTEALLQQYFNQVAGAYFDGVIQVSVYPKGPETDKPDRLEISAKWRNRPINLPVAIRFEENKPHFYISEINGIPLFWVGDNISNGINRGIDEALEKGPVDVTQLSVQEGKITVDFVDSPDPDRPPVATPTPSPTPTPLPTPTPTPVDITLVVIFNDLDRDIMLEVAGQTLAIAAKGNQALQLPPNTYDYIVRDSETEEVIAQGRKTWDLHKAYRLRIGVLNNQE